LSSASAEPPVFLIVAGPNGSGKSSAYQDADIEAFGRSVWIINSDLLAARIRESTGFEAAEGTRFTWQTTPAGAWDELPYPRARLHRRDEYGAR